MLGDAGPVRPRCGMVTTGAAQQGAGARRWGLGSRGMQGCARQSWRGCPCSHVAGVATWCGQAGWKPATTPRYFGVQRSVRLLNTWAHAGAAGSQRGPQAHAGGGCGAQRNFGHVQVRLQASHPRGRRWRSSTSALQWLKTSTGLLQSKPLRPQQQGARPYLAACSMRLLVIAGPSRLRQVSSWASASSTGAPEACL